MIVIAYYTVGTVINYKAMVLQFVRSLERFDLKYDIEEIRDRGSWRKNLVYRPRFILKMLDKYQEPVLSIDVDATVCARPQLLLNNPSCDVAFFCYADQKPCGGTLYFANTEMARKILRAWIAKDKEMPDSRSDEFVLKELFCRKGSVGIFATRLYLPVSYLATPSYRQSCKDISCVITHDVVSCNHPDRPEKPPMTGRRRARRKSQIKVKSKPKLLPSKLIALRRHELLQRKTSLSSESLPVMSARDTIILAKRTSAKRRKPVIVDTEKRRRQEDRMQPGWAPGKPTRHSKKNPPSKRRGVF